MAKENIEEKNLIQPSPDADSDDAEISLIQMIQEQAQEEDADPQRTNITLRKVLGGEILTTDVVRKQIWVIVLVTLFIIAYIAEGYSYKHYMISIDKLNTQLRDAKYRALSVKSDLTEHTRRSKIIDLLTANHDSLLHVADRPAYIVDIPK